MKWFKILLITCIATSCSNDDVDNKNLRTKDSASRTSIDSSAIINDNSKLPADSNTTTVNH